MSKISLTNLVNLENETTAVNAINANNAVIQTAFDNTLSRDGTSPSTMGAILDMNSNQIINLPAPSTVNSPARVVDVVTNPTITVPPVGTSGATVPLLNGNNTFSGTNVFSGTTNLNIISANASNLTNTTLLGAVSGAVTSVTAGTGLSGGTIVSTGTVATNFATKTAQQTGTSTVLSVSPSVQQQHDSAAKAWVSITGSTGAILTSYNVSGVVRNSAGLYTVSFTTPFATTSYVCQVTCELASGAPSTSFGIIGTIANAARNTGSVQVEILPLSLSASVDPNVVHLVCYGRQ